MLHFLYWCGLVGGEARYAGRTGGMGLAGKGKECKYR